MTRALIALALAFSSIDTAFAHEVGTTQVVAEFGRDGNYRIEIAVDPDALLTRLDLADSVPMTVPASPADRDRRIAESADRFLRGVVVRLDRAAVRPRFEYQPAPAEADHAEVPGRIVLSGRGPASARALSFSYAFALGWYALEVRVEDQPTRTFWVEAGQPSESIALTAPATLGASWAVARRLLPLVVLGLVLASAGGSNIIRRARRARARRSRHLPADPDRDRAPRGADLSGF